VSAVDPNRLVALPRDVYLRPTEEVARNLLGRYLVRWTDGDLAQVARLVETEAYLGEGDRASHAWHGRTRRTAPMYEEAGHAYLYFIYGMYWCLNVVTEEVGRPHAVLLRGAEPIAGIEGATDGPGKLCRAFGLDGAFNRADLTASALQITVGEPIADERVAVSPRIGVAYAGEWAERPLRWYVVDSPFVSPRRAASKVRARRRLRSPVQEPEPEQP
jgi:DNA-3-methyladenine glycosylase